MFEYMSVKESARKWDISERRIQKLCEQNRIEGVIRFGHAWAIPKAAKKTRRCTKEKSQNLDF